MAASGDDLISLLEGPVDVPRHPERVDPGEGVLDDGVVAHVLVDHRRAVLESGLHIHDVVEYLVVHIYQIEGVLGDVPGVGHHSRHRFAHVPGLAGREGRSVGLLLSGQPPDGRERPDACEVVGCQHAVDSVESLGRRRVDPVDAGVGEGTAEDGHVEGARRLDIGDEAAPATDEGGVLPARRRNPDPPSLLRRGHVLTPSLDISAAAA